MAGGGQLKIGVCDGRGAISSYLYSMESDPHHLLRHLEVTSFGMQL